MTDVLRLVRRDVRQATSNVMAGIVMFGLVLIPSLFTWFNVAASWDPFANTGNIRVAVASTDEGYQSDLVPVRIDIGEQVLSALRANAELDWVITDETDAVEGTRSGQYYAAIVLPPSFSADMMTFYAAGGGPTDVAYYTNEKLNALAPTITEQGAEGISRQISEVFNETLGDIALGLISSMSDFLADGDTQAALTRLEARVEAVSAQLRSGARTAGVFAELMRTSIPLVEGATSLVTASGAAFDDASGAVGDGLTAAGTLGATLRSATGSLAEAIAATGEGYAAVGARVEDLFEQVDALGAGEVDVLETLATGVQQQVDRYVTVRDTLETEVAPLLPEAAQDGVAAVLARIDEAIARQQEVQDRLEEAARDLTAGNDSAQEHRRRIEEALAEATTAVRAAEDAYTESLQPQLEDLSATLAGIRSDASAIRDNLDGAASTLAGTPGSVVSALSRAEAAAERIAGSLEESADEVDALRGALAEAAETGELGGLHDVVGSDPGVLATSLAEPVRVERTAVFPVAAFGAGMAPLYAVLALWVGALLMTVAIRVDVDRRALPERPELSPTQKYLGRFGVYALTGLAQSTLVTLGLVLFVQIEPAHPFLLLVAGWVTALVFTLIIYTAVVAFGNAGKALAVVLLVIQISGAGGAYPLEMLPQWFQNVSPFLPATHAIDAMRAAIAGVYGGDFWWSLGLLTLFVLPALLLGLVLRRPLITANRELMAALESTKLM